MARSRSDDEMSPKPKSDAYTGMLVVSLLALLTACLLIWLDYRRYPSNEPPKVQPSTASAPANNPPPPQQNVNPPPPNAPVNPMPMPVPMPKPMPAGM